MDLGIVLSDDLSRRAGGMNLPADPTTTTSQAHGASPGGIVEPVWEQLEKSLIELVYGSNLIESAGSSFEVTSQLCQEVFRGNPVDCDTRSRKEVVFHARALNFMIDQVVLNNHSWSEDLILDCHRILYTGLDEDVMPGKYRDYAVAVRYGQPGGKQKQSICMHASAVPTYMNNMVRHLNEELSKAQKTGEIDPYTVAARYHHQFIMIHPFGDGNGRVSRIILNVLLLKYAHRIALFGRHDEEKEKYLAVVRKCRKIFDQEDNEVDFAKQTSHQELAGFVLEKSGRPLL